MIPDSIPFSSVSTGDRIRQTYDGIPELAAGIETVGLIQPIVLTPEGSGYRLVAGGRRHAALTSLGCETLYHAVSSDPNRPGFILKGEVGDPLMDLLTELSENHDRQDIVWYEELPALVRAWREIQRQKHLRGEEIAMRVFGDMLGVSYQDLQASVKIYDAFLANPEKYKTYSTVRQAAAALIRENADAVLKAQLTAQAQTPKGLAKVEVQGGPERKATEFVPPPAVVVDTESPAYHQALETTEDAVLVPGNTEDEVPAPTVHLSELYRHCNSLDLMDAMPDGYLNHIMCDPDYAVSVERLEASVGGASLGVAQASVEDSLSDLRRFITSAFRVVDNNGFCVFFFDMDHWEKLTSFAGSVGWRVQRWPLVWRKTDYRSNAAPSHNFCKNMEYAMVLRKPGAVLRKAQISSIFEAEIGNTREMFNHPFAKPVRLWSWILHAIAHPGQRVYDPFMGSGSSIDAMIQYRATALGSELSENHFANAIFNIQRAYRRVLGEATTFV